MAGTVREEAIKLQKNIGAIYGSAVEKFCPPFEKTDSIVSCVPANGYPLTVQAEDATKVYRCGKNLLKPWVRKETRSGVTFEVYEDGTVVANGTATATAVMSVMQETYIKEGATYTLSGCVGGSNKTYQLFGSGGKAIELYNSSSPHTKTATGSGMLDTKFYVYAGYTASNLVIKPQLEIGSSATPYEQYRETEEFAPNEPIQPIDGVNTIWVDSGNVTVTGRADPIAMIEKLSSAASAASTTV